MDNFLRFSVRFIAGSITLVIFLFISVNGYDLFKTRFYHHQAKSLRNGDSMLLVREVMGKPTAVFEASKRGYKLSVPYERWAYGRIFDWRDCFHSTFPYIFPFRMRVFDPDKTDVTIVFHDNKTIQSIRIPQWSIFD